MNQTKTFQSYTEAKAFYEDQQGDCSLASSKANGWIVQYTESTKPMIDQVYDLLLTNVENNNMVCLDNVDYKKLGINEKQFSGYCSKLTQRGVYYTQSDWNGWAQVK